MLSIVGLTGLLRAHAAHLSALGAGILAAAAFAFRQGDDLAHSAALLLLLPLALVAFWGAWRAARGASHGRPVVVWTAVVAVPAVGLAIAAAALVTDAYALHQAMSQSGSLAVLAPAAAALLWGYRSRLLRLLAIALATSGLMALAAGSSAFRTYFVRDPLLLEAPVVQLRHEERSSRPEPLLERELGGPLQVEAVGPDGTWLVAINPSFDAPTDEALLIDPNNHRHALGQVPATLTDDGRAVSLERQRGRLVLQTWQLEQVPVRGAVTDLGEADDVHFQRLWTRAGGRYHVTLSHGTTPARIDWFSGMLGDPPDQRGTSVLPERFMPDWSYLAQPPTAVMFDVGRVPGRWRAVAGALVGLGGMVPPFAAELALLDANKPARRLWRTRLQHICVETRAGVGDTVACLASDNQTSRLLSLDPTTAELRAIATLPGVAHDFEPDPYVPGQYAVLLDRAVAVLRTDPLRALRLSPRATRCDCDLHFLPASVALVERCDDRTHVTVLPRGAWMLP